TQPPASGIIPQIDHLESVAPDRIQQTTVDSRNVLAFTVKPGDVQRWDANNIGPSGMPNQRAEVSYAAAAGVDKRNSPYNVTSDSGQRSYAMSIKFGDGFRLDQRWATLLQFHESDTNPKPGFQGIAIHGDHMDFATPFHPGTPFASIPVKTRNRYDLKLEINWSAGQDGYIKVFNNNQLVGQYNGPTASPGPYYYLKQGYY